MEFQDCKTQRFVSEDRRVIDKDYLFEIFLNIR